MRKGLHPHARTCREGRDTSDLEVVVKVQFWLVVLIVAVVEVVRAISNAKRT